MRDWHPMAIDGIDAGIATPAIDQVRADLMTEEIKIHPGLGRTPLPTAQDLAIKFAGLVEVPDGKSEMKWGSWFCQFETGREIEALCGSVPEGIG